MADSASLEIFTIVNGGILVKGRTTIGRRWFAPAVLAVGPLCSSAATAEAAEAYDQAMSAYQSGRYELDGALLRHPTFLATPDVEHSLRATFDDGETSTYVQGAAGDIEEVTLAAPAPRTANSPGINSRESPTAAQIAESLLEDGQKKECRTNILIGVNAAMAATTAVIGVFTNWTGESREAAARRIEPQVGVSKQGSLLTLKGRF